MPRLPWSRTTGFSCHGGCILERYRSEHAKAAVAWLPVVEDLQVPGRSRWPARPGSSSGAGQAAPPASATRTPPSSSCRRRPPRFPSRAAAGVGGTAGERPRGELPRPGRSVDDRAGRWGAGLDRHPKRVGDQCRGGPGVDGGSRPPGGRTHPARPRSRPCLAGGVLGTIGDPQLVEAAPEELTLERVGGHLVGLGVPPFRPAGHPGKPSAAPRQLDRAVADHDPPGPSRSSACTRRAPLGAASQLVHLDDEVGRARRGGSTWPTVGGTATRPSPRSNASRTRQATSTGMASAAITLTASNRLLGAPPLWDQLHRPAHRVQLWSPAQQCGAWR